MAAGRPGVMGGGSPYLARAGAAALLLLGAPLLCPGAQSGPASAVAVQRADYRVTEPALAPRRERLLASAAHLRLDDGPDAPGFVLLDRASGVVYSVSHASATVVEVHPTQSGLPGPPMPLARSEQLLPAEGAPAIGGRRPEHRRLGVNREPCLDLVSVDGLLPDLVAAWLQLRRSLALEHRRVLPSVPADLHRPCDLALNVFDGGWPLTYGLPVQMLGPDVPARQLIDYADDEKVAAELFRVPNGYQRHVVGRLPR